ncbi:MAG: multidrug effflux MFS transporter [Marinobacterium sp.]|nr:multidrug effflux MFS transporter [Marinobacterium sp.]
MSQRTPPFTMLLAMAMASPLALNIFAPVMPTMVEHFASTPFTIQLGFTLYLLSLAFGQLVSGPLADRYGRRPVLLWGFALHIAGCLLGALAVEVWQLLLGRVLQALGGCTGMLLARSILLDQHGRDQAAGLLGYITLGIASAQALAPALGGYLNLASGWQSVFWLSMAMGSTVWLAAIWWLPETSRKSDGDNGLKALFKRYPQVLRNRQYLCFSLSSTLIAACFFAFITSAPFVANQWLGGSSADYGNWFLLVAGGFFLGSMTAGRISARLGVNRMMILGHSLSMLAALTMLASFHWQGVSWPGLFASMALFTFGRGLSQPAAQSAAIASTPGAVATASGLLGFIQLLAGSAIAQLTPRVIELDVRLLPVTLLVASLLALLIYRLGRGHDG